LILVQPGEYAEIERLNTELIDAAEATGEKPHPDPAIWIARTYLERAEYQKARDWYQKALMFAGDQQLREKPQAIQGPGTICIREGRYDDARKQLGEALKIQRNIDDRDGEGITWHQLASIDSEEDKYDDARTKFTRPRLPEERKSWRGASAIWHQLGSIDLEQNNTYEATNAFNKALDIARQLGNRKAEADAIHQLGRTRFRAGGRREGLDLLKTALAIRRAINDRAGEAVSFRRLAEVSGDAGDLDLALRLAMVGHGINSAIQASTKRDLEEIKRWTVVQYPAQQVDTLQEEANAQYLADRGKTLLKRLRARP
jgi:tetratricopeptide (TPR) repeat protein